jgi:hypothetical protein
MSVRYQATADESMSQLCRRSVALRCHPEASGSQRVEGPLFVCQFRLKRNTAALSLGSVILSAADPVRVATGRTRRISLRLSSGHGFSRAEERIFLGVSTPEVRRPVRPAIHELRSSENRCGEK